MSEALQESSQAQAGPENASAATEEQQKAGVYVNPHANALTRQYRDGVEVRYDVRVNGRFQTKRFKIAQGRHRPDGKWWYQLRDGRDGGLLENGNDGWIREDDDDLLGRAYP